MKLALFTSALLLLPYSAWANDECDDVADTAIGAALDSPRSVYDLGVAFYLGSCVNKDYPKAAYLWDKAQKLGVLPAKNNLGYLLSRGLGVEKDEARAVSLWRDAALQGHAESQVHLGSAIYYGRGVPSNPVEGLAWILVSVESSRSRPDTAEGGGGAAVLEMAMKARAEMLEASPSLLERSSSLSRSLLPEAH